MKSRCPTPTMSQLPFPFGGGLHFQPTHNHNQNTPANMPAANPAVHSNIPQTQQAAFMQNAQLPGIDMATVLQGITPEQLAYIGQLYQSGQIPLPPAQAMPATNAQPAIQQNGNGSSVSRQEMDPTAVDVGSMEREAGEVTPQKEPDFLHPPPTGPKKRSGSIHMRPDHNSVDKRAKRQPSPPRQPQGYDRRRPEPRTGKCIRHVGLIATSTNPRQQTLKHLPQDHKSASVKPNRMLQRNSFLQCIVLESHLMT